MLQCKDYEIKTLLNNSHFYPSLFEAVLFDIEVRGTDELIIDCDGIDLLGNSIKVIFSNVSICAWQGGKLSIQLKDGTFIVFIKSDRKFIGPKNDENEDD